jgi:hypothetical protein
MVLFDTTIDSLTVFHLGKTLDVKHTAIVETDLCASQVYVLEGMTVMKFRTRNNNRMRCGKLA